MFCANLQRDNSTCNRVCRLTFQMRILRDIMQGDEKNPKVPMENNCRPTMPPNDRPVRTNINFPNPVSRATTVTFALPMRLLYAQTYFLQS